MKMNPFWSLEIWPDDNIAEIATGLGSASLLNYSVGFLEVAEVACARARLGASPADIVMPAILYNICHSVELFLKHILCEIEEIHRTDVRRTGHKISSLFNKHRDLIENYLEAEGLTTAFPYRRWLTEFGELVDFVGAFDWDGQTARYPADLKDAPNWNGKALVSTSDVCCLIEYIKGYYDEFRYRDT